MIYSSRYSFILFEVDAPIKQRFQRFKVKYDNQDPMNFEDFIDLDDMVKGIILKSLGKLY